MTPATPLSILQGRGLRSWEKVPPGFAEAFAEAGVAFDEAARAWEGPLPAAFEVRTRTDELTRQAVLLVPEADGSRSLWFASLAVAEAVLAGEEVRSGDGWRTLRVAFVEPERFPPPERKVWVKAVGPRTADGRVPVGFTLGFEEAVLPGGNDPKFLAGVMSAFAEDPAALAAGRPVKHAFRKLGKRATSFELRAVKPYRPPAAGEGPGGKGWMVLHAELQRVEPAIWRRLRVPAGWTLAGLHSVLQEAFGFENAHLHGFERLGPRNKPVERYLVKGSDGLGFIDPNWPRQDRDETEVTLGEALPEVGGRLRYSYDFGDGWRIDLERKTPAAADEPASAGAADRPVCLEGARSGPPEDCGGPWGYAELLEMAGQPAAEVDEEYRGWVAALRPEEFWKEAINAELAGLPPH